MVLCPSTALQDNCCCPQAQGVQETALNTEEVPSRPSRSGERGLLGLVGAGVLGGCQAPQPCSTSTDPWVLTLQLLKSPWQIKGRRLALTANQYSQLGTVVWTGSAIALLSVGKH